MTLNAKEAPRGGIPNEPIEPGSYPGRLVQVIDFGLQPQTYNNEPKPPMRELGTTYELVDEFLKDEDGNDLEDKPRWISESFPFHNLASERAKSTARYYALDPNGKFDGDWGKLLGSPVMVTIVQSAGKGKNKGKIFNNIASTSSMRSKEAEKCPELVNKPSVFDLADTSKENLQRFHDFPQWISDKIKNGLEFAGSDFQIALESFTPAKKDKKEPKKNARVEVEETNDVEENGNW